MESASMQEVRESVLARLLERRESLEANLRSMYRFERTCGYSQGNAEDIDRYEGYLAEVEMAIADVEVMR